MFQRIPYVAVPAALMPLLLMLSWAQTKIDSDHSTASLTLVSSDGTESLNVGIAKVSGLIKLTRSNPEEDALDLYIYPARQDSRLLNPDGSFRQAASANLSRYTLMTFHSNRSALRPDGRLEIVGELTITYFDRHANTYWSNAYAGPDYGGLYSQCTTHEASFIVDQPSSTALAAGTTAKGEISAVAKITSQNFPALRSVLMDAVWPIVVEDEHCEMPQARPSMRDYTGAKCTGKLVEVTPPAEAAQYYFGSDYPGPNTSSPPPADGATIVLHLRLTQ